MEPALLIQHNVAEEPQNNEWDDFQIIESDYLADHAKSPTIKTNAVDNEYLMLH